MPASAETWALFQAAIAYLVIKERRKRKCTYIRWVEGQDTDVAVALVLELLTRLEGFGTGDDNIPTLLEVPHQR
jgi:hypothetical protein